MLFYSYIFFCSFVVMVCAEYLTEEELIQNTGYRRLKRQNRYADIPLRTIIMKVDNFDSSNNKTWIMRFYETRRYYRQNGPLFILNGGEQSITPFPLDYSLMAEMAKQHGAHMVNLEHRYYGSSVPDSSFSYLTVEQALADMVFFIQEYKRVHPELRSSKVLIFGTSYSGTLAIWMRLKYPNYVHAVMASSAPVLAKLDFHEYWEEIYRLLGQNCTNAFTKVENDIKNILRQPDGQAILQRDFNISGPVSLIRLQYMLQGNMLFLVNQNQCGSLDQNCRALLSPKQSEYRIMTGIRKRHNSRKKFLDTYYDNNQNYLAWFYQLCTQFGFFQTNKLTSLESQVNECPRVFGPGFSRENVKKGINNLNANFGGRNIHVTRVVAIYGTGDPWHVLGLRQSSNPENPVFYIPGSAHGKDVYPVNPNCDNQQMIDTKNAVQAYITKWIQEN